jgi:hypothetical protein
MPTFNCARWMPKHLETMQAWADLATEIIVVDSDSTDGTLELVQKGLTHPSLRILQHPRGLYQSWNFGLQQVRTKYVYISTVGDSISREGLEHLLGVAEKFGSDVVLSKPHSISHDDQLMPDEGYWPIQQLLTTLSITKPEAVPGMVVLIFALLGIPGGILGSSASNLYLAQVLHRSPFPTGFGITGDGAWAIENAFACKFAVTPEIFSTFRHHPKSYPAKEYEVTDLSERLLQLVIETLAVTCGQDTVAREEASRLGCHDFFRAARKNPLWNEPLLCQQLEESRSRMLPWIFNPAAWQARTRRDKLRIQRQTLLEKIAASWQRSQSAGIPSPNLAGDPTKAVGCKVNS